MGHVLKSCRSFFRINSRVIGVMMQALLFVGQPLRPSFSGPFGVRAVHERLGAVVSAISGVQIQDLKLLAFLICKIFLVT